MHKNLQIQKYFCTFVGFLCAHAFPTHLLRAPNAPVTIMTIIALDSSTEVCSAALLQDGQLLAERLNLSGSNHAALLPTYVQELQAEASARNLSLDGIVLSEGPGSYTGLRIAASLAKGLCYGSNIPLYAVPTLAVIATAANPLPANALICPMIDARRMEVYCAVYDTALNIVSPLEPLVVTEQSFASLLDEHPIYFCGNGAAKCKTLITHPNAYWLDGIVPTAVNAGRLHANPAYSQLVRIVAGKDIAYFEPNYLKDFIAAPAHVKGLH